MAMKISKGELHGLDLQVDGLGAVGVQLLDPHTAQKTQRHERGDPLPIRRDLVQGRVREGLPDRAAPVVAVRRQIIDGQARPVFGSKGRDPLGQFAFIERPSLGLGDQAERPRQWCTCEPFAWPGRAPAGHEGFSEAGKFVQCRCTPPPEFPDHRSDDEAPFGIADGGLEKVCEGQRAEAFRKINPARDCTGNSDAFETALGHGTAPGEPFGRPTRGRASRGVEPVKCASVRDDAEGIRAEAVPRRLDHSEGDRGRKDGVDRVAASLDHAEPGLRCERVRGRNDIGRHHRRSARCISIEQNLQLLSSTASSKDLQSII